MFNRSLFTLFALLSTHGIDAQQRPSHAGKRTLLPRNVEIALARSAAPPSVSSTARVLVFVDTAFVVADSGTNGVTCVVNRSWPTSLEPHCYDEEASASILPMELHRMLMLHRGRSDSEVERDIGIGLANGTFRVPRRPAMSYMMSDGQVLVDDNGKPAGKWRPHIMIYYPYLRGRDVGFGASPDMKVGMVADEGSATSSIIVIMPQFIPVVSASPMPSPLPPSQSR